MPTDDLPAGLTDADTARIAVAIAAARTAATRRLYALVWGQWARWCAARGIPAPPGDPLALCPYLTKRAAAGRAIGTLDMACTAIRHVHRMAGVDDPVAAEAVRQVRCGLHRTHGAAARRLARPLGTEEISQIVDGSDRATPIGARDAAIILLGYASAMRRAELVALTLADVEHRPAGLLLTRIWGTTVSTDPLSGHVPARMLRARAEAAGLDGTRITAHSLRAGHATTAALAGVPLDWMGRQPGSMVTQTGRPALRSPGQPPIHRDVVTGLLAQDRRGDDQRGRRCRCQRVGAGSR